MQKPRPRQLTPEAQPPAPRAAVRGAVESYDPRIGVVGWLATLDDTARTARAQLVADDAVLATVSADILRPELRRLVPPRLTEEPWVGFRFPPAALALAAALPADRRKHALEVRDARSGEVLSGLTLPTAEEVLAAVGDGDDSVRDVGRPTQSPRTAGELVRTLETLRFDAGALVTLPLALTGSAHHGFIEVVLKVAAGLYIVGGWTMGAVAEFSTALLLIEGRKTPAAAFCAPYERPDLPAGAVAFCGVVRTDANLWRTDQDFILTFGEQTRFMKGRRPLNLLSTPQGLAWLANATKVAPAEKDLIADVVRIKLEGPASPEQHGCHISIDRLNIYPDFGALVRGWVLSPRGELAGVSVRQGAFHAEARRERMVIGPRPDLVAGFPHLADRTRRAGFSAVCLGPLSVAGEERERPVITLGLSTGVEFEMSATPQNTRVGFSTRALEDLVSDFPALSSETFFQDLSRASAGALRRSRPELQFIRRAGGRVMLIFNMPLPAGDARLALSDIARGTRSWPDVAVNVVFGPDHDRSAIMRAVQDVMPDQPVGIVQHDGRADLSRVVAQILGSGGAETLTLVQPGSRLRRGGWEAAAAYHASSSLQRLQLYTLDDSLTRHLDYGQSVGALNWTAEGFLNYARSAIPTVGAGLLGRDLTLSPGAETAHGMVDRYHASRLSGPAARLSADMERSLLQMRSP